MKTFWDLRCTLSITLMCLWENLLLQNLPPCEFLFFLSAFLPTVSIDCINTQPLYFPFSNLVLLMKRSQVSRKFVRGVIVSCSIQSLQPCRAERKTGVPTHCPINTLLVHLRQFEVYIKQITPLYIHFMSALRIKNIFPLLPCKTWGILV